MRRTEVGGVAKRIEVKSDKGKREHRKTYTALLKC
jgi:hypothetical protein